MIIILFNKLTCIILCYRSLRTFLNQRPITKIVTFQKLIRNKSIVKHNYDKPIKEFRLSIMIIDNYRLFVYLGLSQADF